MEVGDHEEVEVLAQIHLKNYMNVHGYSIKNALFAEYGIQAT